jgi:hypothetical protein
VTGVFTNKAAAAKHIREHLYTSYSALCAYCGAGKDDPLGQERCQKNPERLGREARLFEAIGRSR